MLVNFSWLIQGILAGSGQIGGWSHSGDVLDKDIQRLGIEGIRAIVSLTEQPLPVEKVEMEGMSYLHLPILDMSPPSLYEISSFVEFVDHSKEKKRPVLVHCEAGLGRTGTMLASYLINMGLSPIEAMANVRRSRPGSIETLAQERALFEYSASFHERN